MGLSGSLKDFDVGDVFQLIAGQQKTGTLVIRRSDRNVHIYFRDGRFVRAEPVDRGESSPLASLLALAEVITPDQFDNILIRQKKTLKSIEDLLIEQDLVTSEVLDSYIKLQTTETIYQLFLWKTGEYEFVPGEVPTGRGWNVDLNAESILMEGVRMKDEWPVIRNIIPSPYMTMVLLRTLDGRPLNDFDNLPPLTCTLTKNDRMVYALIRDGRTVRKLAALSKLGEFETSAILKKLVDNGFVKPLKPDKTKIWADEIGDQRWQAIAGALSQLAFGVLLLAILVFVTIVLLDRITSKQLSAETSLSPEEFREPLGNNQLDRLKRAVEIYHIEYGQYPESLLNLIEAGYIKEKDLSYPYGDEFLYRKNDKEDNYILLRPLK